MADAVRFAIVGLGMGRGRADRCMETEGAELVAICDLSEERGAAASGELGVPWVQSYDELLARDDVDVIGLWTPSGTHAGMATKALAAGKHVCMTKPMDITTAACDRAIHEADSRGLLLGIDFQERYLPANHRVKQAIDSGAVGRLLRADLRMYWFRGQAYYDAGMPQAWRSRLDTEGGSLANQAVHFVDLLLWWAGTPERVVGCRGTYGHDIETEDGTTAVVQFREGAMGSIVTTTCAVPNRGHEVTLSGTWGTLTWAKRRRDDARPRAGGGPLGRRRVPGRGHAGGGRGRPRRLRGPAGSAGQHLRGHGGRHPHRLRAAVRRP